MGGQEPGRLVSPPIPPPRVFVVARDERSPGFGRFPLAFPVSQWRVSERPAYPLQWRGRAGLAPASEHPDSRLLLYLRVNLRCGLPPGKFLFHRRLECGALVLVASPFLGGHLVFPPGIARIEPCELVEERARG